jgi:hypothetical protein
MDSMSEEKDKNLINFIATTVEGMRDRLDRIQGEMATKDDLARVESNVARIESNVARIESKVVRVESRLDVKTTAIRGDIERVQLRLDSIDHALSGRMSLIEGQISRLRSVVYLLVKDKPEMLSLLGQSQPGESRPQG